jgi:2-keto-4-pentenoate hydratase
VNDTSAAERAAGSLAAALETAWSTKIPLEPFGARGLLVTPEDAYATQRQWASLRASRGERTVGRKIGLTSPGMRAQMGVDEPDYGDLWASRQFIAVDGRLSIPLGPFIQPRVEGELAFLLRSDLAGPGITAEDARAASSAAAVALEVVDSRIADWRIQLVDTIADNASFGGFGCGEWSTELLDADMASVPMTVSRNGEVKVTECGAAVLGSPLEAVAWLGNKLSSFGVTLRAGDIVLSGSFGRAIEVEPGDEFLIAVPGEAELVASFT